MPRPLSAFSVSKPVLSCVLAESSTLKVSLPSPPYSDNRPATWFTRCVAPATTKLSVPSPASMSVWPDTDSILNRSLPRPPKIVVLPAWVDRTVKVSSPRPSSMRMASRPS